MIALCVAKIGKNKYSITTTDMKDKLEAKYFQEQQKNNMEAQGQHMGDPYFLLRQQAAAQQQQRPATASPLGWFWGGTR